MAGVELRDIAKSFGRTRVLAGVDLAIRDGEFLTLVGPSGCGKSTLLRIIAGLEPQDAGTVAIGGAPVDHLRPRDRNVAMVFQSYALYPHMSVFDNIAMPLVMSRLSLIERLPLIGLLSPRRRGVMRAVAAEVRAVAAQLQVEELLGRRPAQLSGGQRQRVALGRAMVRQPDVFLMDEPLSNLDAKLRVHMRTELAELHGRLGATFIYVTHDQVEAMTMSSRVALMDAGDLLQVGTPAELYDTPANLRVAQFIGSPAINLLPGIVDERGAVQVHAARLALRLDSPPGTQVTVGIRPEAVVLTEAGDGGALKARLRRVENLGAELILHFDLIEPAIGGVTSRVPAHDRDGGSRLAAVGEVVGLRLEARACHLFAGDGMRIEPVESGAAPSPARLAGTG